MTETKNSSVEFKIPNDFKEKQETPDNFHDSDSVAKEQVSVPKGKCEKKALINVPLPYKEPDWSGTPCPNYSLEVIKNGTFVDTIDIDSSLIVFGRLDVCKVVFEHPSVSRYHAVIQYCKGDDAHQKGFYLYDLGSTHGTFLNKEKIKPKIYYKLKVGYILKFGGSSRLHIFQGPDEEVEIKEEKPVVSEKNEDICNWGIGDDAEEEEDLTENPFALSTPNEELYVDDPKKTLRGWFEREGYELEYNVEEKGFKTFMCRIQLPIDTPSGDFMSVEASVTGKKKEAVAACALEACRTLDRLGMLRQSHHESRQRKKKKWEENDYYDSDEDIFLDRTGTIERKREMRKRAEKKTEAETCQSLEAKLKAIDDEIIKITSKLSTDTAAGDSNALPNVEDDSLEAYMSSLSESGKGSSDKVERTKLKVRLAEAEKEKMHLEKLLDIAKPTKLPPVLKYPGMIGKRLKKKIQLHVSSSNEQPKLTALNVNEQSDEEIESDEGSNTVIPVQAGKSKSVKANKEANCYKKYSFELEDKRKKIKEVLRNNVQEIAEEVPKAAEKLKSIDDENGKDYGLLTKDEYEKKKEVKEAILEQTCSNLTNYDKGLNFTVKRPIGPMETCKDILETDSMSKKSLSSKRSKKKNDSENKVHSDVYMTETAEYSNWTPPPNQSGDGITHLNAKYGY